MTSEVLISGGLVLELGGGGGTLAIPQQSASLQITTGALPSVNQYATTYNGPLTGTGGQPPYNWLLVSQSGFNPNTWQIVGSAITNLMPMIFNVETVNLVVQLTDSAVPPNSVQKTLTITTNRQIPAGAQALGYTSLIWSDQPTLSEISFASYGSTITTKWQAGWPYIGTIPPAALFTMNANGVLQLTNTGGATGQGPTSYRPIMSSVQLSNGSNVPIAAGLPVWSVGNGYYIEYSVQMINPNSGSWVQCFQFPTQHNVANTQDIDPFDGLHRFLELDVYEGSGSNAQNAQAGNWGGNVPYWAGNPATAFRNPNTTPPEFDTTLQHVYGSSWNPTTAVAKWYADNVQSGSAPCDSTTGTPMTAEQLAWVNGMTHFAMFGVANNITTGYASLLYYVSVYGPPSSSPVPTNVQVILQGQSSPVATRSPGCNTTNQSSVKAPPYQPNYNYVGWLNVSGAQSYNIYRAINGGGYSLYASISDSAAQTNYTNYAALYPAPAQTFGNYTVTQCGPASSINRAYYDTAATGAIGNNGNAGGTFNVIGNITNGSTLCTITSVNAGAMAVGQGIGTLAGYSTISTQQNNGSFFSSAAPGSNSYIPIGTTIASFGTSTGGAGTINLSQPAVATQTGINIGSVQWGNTGYTYYVTAVTNNIESPNSAYAYLPFMTNGNLVHCNGAFDAYIGTQQTPPAVSPLGYSVAVSANISPGHFQSINLFSGNSAVNYNLNTVGYNYLYLSLCPNQAGHGPANTPAEICGDAPLLTPSGTALSAYAWNGSSYSTVTTWPQNQWTTYRFPISIFNTDSGTGVPQTAMYKITWGIGGTFVANDILYFEYYFAIN